MLDYLLERDIEPDYLIERFAEWGLPFGTAESITQLYEDLQNIKTKTSLEQIELLKYRWNKEVQWECLERSVSTHDIDWWLEQATEDILVLISTIEKEKQDAT